MEGLSPVLCQKLQCSFSNIFVIRSGPAVENPHLVKLHHFSCFWGCFVGRRAELDSGCSGSEWQTLQCSVAPQRCELGCEAALSLLGWQLQRGAWLCCCSPRGLWWLVPPFPDGPFVSVRVTEGSCVQNAPRVHEVGWEQGIASSNINCLLIWDISLTSESIHSKLHPGGAF